MKKLLIADDDAAIRLLVSAILANEDYEVIEAADGREALDRIRLERPDLAILDVEMPRMNGLEVCRLVRADPQLASVVVIILTSLGTPRDVAEGLAAGANLYLSKPFRPVELLQAIEQAVRDPMD